MAPKQPNTGLFVGLNEGHVVTKKELAPRPSDRKGIIMEQVKRSRRLMHPCTQHLIQDVPQELIQYIQSLLPVKEAARTSVLSKSWLHAWSTIPTLRFLQSVLYLTKQQKANYIKLIDGTLTRYLCDNIPIITFHLHFGIENKESACLAENWIRPVASKSCLKELYLTIWFGISFPFTMPDEIFSGENLDKLSVTDQGLSSYSIFISSNPVINCVNLRVLELINVDISQELLDNLFSTCNLLRKVKLSLPKGVMMTAKVRNLPHLRVLKVLSKQPDHNLEIYNVPSLRQFSYDTSLTHRFKLLSFKTDLLVHVRKLFLAGVIMDNAFLDIINSKFPCLERLTLVCNFCMMETLDIRGVFLMRLRIRMWAAGKLVSIQVYAPKLHYFRYTGPGLDSLFFPAITPEQIHLRLELETPIDTSFFLKLREVLNFRTNFKIKLTSYQANVLPVDIDVNDVRRRVPIPATNVQQIYFSFPDGSFWEHSPFFDAFFSICHPKYVKAHQLPTCTMPRKISYFWKKIVTGMMERKTIKKYWPDLEDIEIKHPVVGKWKTLTRYWLCFAEKDRVKFRLTWCSP